MNSIIRYLCCFFFSLSLWSGAPREVRYSVSVDRPGANFFSVSMEFSATPSVVSFALPNTRPGDVAYYNNAKFLSKMRVSNDHGFLLRMRRSGKESWKLNIPGSCAVVINYQIQMNPTDILKFSTNWINEDGGYFDGSSIFLYLDSNDIIPSKIKLVLPSSWEYISALPKQGEWSIANSYNQLIDSPFVFGSMTHQNIKIGNINFHFIFDKNIPKFDISNFEKNIELVVQNYIQIFGSSPFKNYLILFSWRPDLDFGGGIEHKECAVINVGKLWMEDFPKNSIGTIAHELFHAWNAEQFYPSGLNPWNYKYGKTSQLLWFVEGIASYYSQLVRYRSNILPKSDFFNHYSNKISAFENDPNRQFITLSEAGIIEWMRSDENIDYYLGGEIIGLLLDLQIRASTKNNKSLDDVMRVLYANSKKVNYKGYSEIDLINIINKIGNFDIRPFFNNQINNTQPILYNKFFQPFSMIVDSKMENNKKKFVLQKLMKNSSPRPELPFLHFSPIEEETKVLFICEHGNAKSLMAASYFNQLAQKKGLPIRAISRGSAPDSTTVPTVIAAGLDQDGIDVSNFHPTKVTDAELSESQCVILINTDLPTSAPSHMAKPESWSDIPPATINYSASRKAIKKHVKRLIDRLSAPKAKAP